MYGAAVFLLCLGLGGGERGTSPTSRTETDRYAVEMRPAQKAYRAGTDGKVEVLFEAKGEFKLNAQYPLKLKMEAAPEGISIEKAVLKREDARTTDKGGSFTVSFTPQKAGTFKIAGVLSVSFCSEKTCVMEKLPLDTEVVVK